MRQLRSIGKAIPGQTFFAALSHTLNSAWKPADLPVVFVPECASRHILGATALSLAGK